MKEILWCLFLQIRTRKLLKLTCKNTTVVDYCISSPELISHVINFEIFCCGSLLLLVLAVRICLPPSGGKQLDWNSDTF